MNSERLDQGPRSIGVLAAEIVADLRRQRTRLTTENGRHYFRTPTASPRHPENTTNGLGQRAEPETMRNHNENLSSVS